MAFQVEIRTLGEGWVEWEVRGSQSVGVWGD